jgi:hypothetical protein
MSKLRFLVDECTGTILINALRKAAVGIDVCRVGEPGAPPCGTLDPDLLLAAETMQRCLLTQDKSTMPGYLIGHFGAGHHTWGVMFLRQGFALARYVQAIVNHWATTEDVDWIDRMVHVP